MVKRITSNYRADDLFFDDNVYEKRDGILPVDDLRQVISPGLKVTSIPSNRIDVL
jgi:hypothetical protein